MKKVVSFSLWGNNPRYIEGAIKNCFLSAKYYPDWECRIYVEESLHHLLKGIPAKIISPLVQWKNGRFWRFLPAFESDVDVVISRDCDSRIGEREVRCVNEWLESGKKLHVIRDHPRHYDFPILAGMWGIRGGLGDDVKSSIFPYSQDPSEYIVDQVWLMHNVWVNHTTNVHVSGIKETLWMQQKSVGLNFVGQGYNENDEALYR